MKNSWYLVFILSFFCWFSVNAFKSLPLADTLQEFCNRPTYAVGGVNVSAPNRNDGQIFIKGIESATHYEILQGNTAKFDFNQANTLTEGQSAVIIKGLKNPTSDLVYRIRLYNLNETCYTDQSVHLNHINFAENLTITDLSVIQGIDNPNPQIGDVVTFTTIISNKGTKTADNVQLSQFFTKTLEVIFFYADQGEYSPITNSWDAGKVGPGKSPKLVIRTRVTAQGIAYLTSYLSKVGKEVLRYGQGLSTQDRSIATAATSCASVPIDIKKDEVYKITLQNYGNVKWYYKDVAGNFAQITEFTNPAIAEINPDSSLSIKHSGEFSYTRTVDKCTFNACCPVVVQSCKGPNIILDSVYCNKNVDSYDIVVHLQNDNWSLVERVYYAMANLGYPVLTNFLRRLNLLPLTSSAGLVRSLGGGSYKISNVPAFMPNVTLVSTDISGECRNVKIVNAPNCQQGFIPQPELASNVEFFTPGASMPNLRIMNPDKSYKAEWYTDELGRNRIGRGNQFRPDEIGKVYVAFVDKKSGNRSALIDAEIKDITATMPGEFINVSICDCKNPSMLPDGTPEEYTVARIFPNPVSENLHVEYNIPVKTKSADVFVFTITGQSIGSYALDTKQNVLDVESSKWPDGVYLMTMIVDGQKKLTQRFVVRH